MQDEKKSGPFYEGITQLLTLLTLQELGLEEYYWGAYLGEVFSCKILMEFNEGPLTEVYRGRARHGVSMESFLRQLGENFFPGMPTDTLTHLKHYFQNWSQLKSLDFMKLVAREAERENWATKLIHQMRRPQLLFQAYFTWRFSNDNVIGQEETEKVLREVLIPSLITQQRADPITRWLVREVIALSYFDWEQNQVKMRPEAFEIVEQLLRAGVLDAKTKEKWERYLTQWRPKGTIHMEGEGGEGLGMGPTADFPTSAELPLEMDPESVEKGRGGGGSGGQNVPTDVPLEGKDQGTHQKTDSAELLKRWNRVIEESLKPYQNRQEVNLEKVLQELLDSRLREWLEYLQSLPESEEKASQAQLLEDLLGYAYSFSTGEIASSASDEVTAQVLHQYLNTEVDRLLQDGEEALAYKLCTDISWALIQGNSSYQKSHQVWIDFNKENILRFAPEIGRGGLSRASFEPMLRIEEERYATILTHIIRLAEGHNLFPQQDLERVLQKISGRDDVHSALKVLVSAISHAEANLVKRESDYQTLRKQVTLSKNSQTPIESGDREVYYWANRLLYQHSRLDPDKEEMFQSLLESQQDRVRFYSLNDFFQDQELTESEKTEYWKRLLQWAKQGEIARVDLDDLTSWLIKPPPQQIQSLYPSLKEKLLVQVNSVFDGLMLLALDRVLEDPQERLLLFEKAQTLFANAELKQDKALAGVGYLYMFSKQPENPNYRHRVLSYLETPGAISAQWPDWAAEITRFLFGSWIHDLFDATVLVTLQQPNQTKKFVGPILNEIERIVKEEQLQNNHSNAIAFAFGYDPGSDSPLRDRVGKIRAELKEFCGSFSKSYHDSLFFLLGQSQFLDREAFVEYWKFYEETLPSLSLSDTPGQYKDTLTFAGRWQLPQLLPGIAHGMTQSIGNKTPQAMGQFLTEVRDMVPDQVRLEFETSLYFCLSQNLQDQTKHWIQQQVKTEQDAERIKRQLVHVLRYLSYDEKNPSLLELEFPTQALNLKTRFVSYLAARESENDFFYRKRLEVQEILRIGDVQGEIQSELAKEEARKDLNNRLQTICSLNEKIRLGDQEMEEILPSNAQLIFDSLEIHAKNPPTWVTLYLVMAGLVSLWTKYESDKKWGEFLDFTEEVWNSVEQEGERYQLSGSFADPEVVWRKFVQRSPKRLKQFFQQYQHLSSDEKGLFLTLLYAEYALFQDRLGVAKEGFREELIGGIKRVFLLTIPEIKKALSERNTRHRVESLLGKMRGPLSNKKWLEANDSILLGVLNILDSYSQDSAGVRILKSKFPGVSQAQAIFLEQASPIFIHLLGKEELLQKGGQGEAMMINVDDLSKGIQLPEGTFLESDGRILLSSGHSPAQAEVFPIGRAKGDTRLNRRTIPQLKKELEKIIPAMSGYISMSLAGIQEKLEQVGVSQVIVSAPGPYFSVGYMREDRQLAGETIPAGEVLEVAFRASQETRESTTTPKTVSQINIAQQNPQAWESQRRKVSVEEREGGSAAFSHPREFSERMTHAIDLQVRKELANSIFHGEQLSSYQSRGVEPMEWRFYQSGDDLRSIDWKATAKRGDNRIIARETESEHKITVMVVIDVSWENLETAAAIFATLGNSVVKKGDKIGLYLNNQEEREFFAPRSNAQEVRVGMVGEVLQANPGVPSLEVNRTLSELKTRVNEKSILFWISERALPPEKSIRVPEKYEMVGITLKRASADNEIILNPPARWIRMKDPTSDQEVVVEFSQQRRFSEALSQSL